MDNKIFSSIVSVFERQAILTPDRIAVSDDKKRVTYAELEVLATNFTHVIKNNLHHPHENFFIAIYLNRNVDLVVAMLSVLKINCAYLLLDPNQPHGYVLDCIKTASPELIITNEASNKKSSLLKKLNHIHKLFINYSYDNSASLSSALNLAHSPRVGDDIAYVNFTSGTTGNPKGIMIENRSLINVITFFKNLLKINHDRFLSVTSQSFDIFNLEVFLPLVSGAECVLYPRKPSFDTEDLKDFMLKTQPTIMQATPSLWNLLLQIGLPKLPKMTALVGGEMLSETLAKNLYLTYKRVYNLYGPTETTIWSTCHRVNQIDYNSIGLPISNTNCYVLNKALEPVSVNKVGELYIGGTGLAKGYLNNQQLTSKAFISHPNTQERLYKTGDLVKQLKNGNLRYIGRIDHQLKINGHRIEVEAIENKVLSLPFIKQVCFVTIPDANKFVLFFSVKNGPKEKMKQENEIRGVLNHWFPATIIPPTFMALDELPLMTNGKVDRSYLKNFALQNTNITKVLSAKIEDEILNIWRKVLNNAEIDIKSDFTMLGGNSIHIPEIIYKINKKFNANITLRKFMENQTIEKLSKLIKEQA